MAHQVTVMARMHIAAKDWFRRKSCYQTRDVSDCVDPELLCRGIADVEQIFRAAAQKSDQSVTLRLDARLSRGIERGDTRGQQAWSWRRFRDNEISQQITLAFFEDHRDGTAGERRGALRVLRRLRFAIKSPTS